jgi:hypothetical protein
MSTRIKIVPDATPDADGEWLDIPVDLPDRTRWIAMESRIRRFTPAGYHVVAVERGVGASPRLTLVGGVSQNRQPVNAGDASND